MRFLTGLGRRTAESFNSCVAKNMSNFCCDASGCAAFVLEPEIVLAAVGITCLGSGALSVHAGTGSSSNSSG